jgi:hypothetical protein
MYRLYSYLYIGSTMMVLHCIIILMSVFILLLFALAICTTSEHPKDTPITPIIALKQAKTGNASKSYMRGYNKGRSKSDDIINVILWCSSIYRGQISSKLIRSIPCNMIDEISGVIDGINKSGNPQLARFIGGKIMIEDVLRVHTVAIECGTWNIM